MPVPTPRQSAAPSVWLAWFFLVSCVLASCAEDLAITGGGAVGEVSSDAKAEIAPSDSSDDTPSDLADAATCSAGPEQCNGQDDDCDGQTDEDPCDDANLCTAGDQCVQGACVGASLVACDDKNTCTIDTCDPSAGCGHAPLAGPCDDGDVCTIGDNCSSGACLPGAASPCDDGDACTVGDHCQGGLCLPGTATGCDDGNTCTVDTCGATGGCAHLPGSITACDDGNPCTEADNCETVGGAILCQGLAKPCSDNNSCTVDTCDPSKGCLFVLLPDQATCNDGNACTLGDFCDHDGLCKGVAQVCDDQDPCTADACVPGTGSCVFSPATGAPCSDGQACTSGDACKAGVCQSGAAVVCDDGEGCTEDSCDPSSGKCLFLPTTTPCSDGNACTQGDVCSGGVCAPGPLTDCDDKNPCNIDGCDVSTGSCSHLSVADGVGCSDGDACTAGDECQKGVCQPGVAPQCADGNACTSDGCDPASGLCVFEPLTASPCDDGDSCTVADSCQGGVCQAGIETCQCKKISDCKKFEDGDACNGTLVCRLTDHTCQLDPSSVVLCDASKNTVCVSWACDPFVGKCLPKNLSESGPCDADNSQCTPGDHCQAGVCLPGDVTDCNDKVSCTLDWCDPGLGCQHQALNIGCDDGDGCTLDDVCVAGVCQGSLAKPCDDGNACTSDGCVAGTCTIKQLTGTVCDDGNPCSVGDACAKGQCQSGALKPCSGGDSCNLPYCDTANGQCKIKVLPDAIPCQDGVPCTLGDKCKGGKCLSGASLCPESVVPCMFAQCDVVAKVCVDLPAPSGGSCSDGDPCTVSEKCLSGKCMGGYPKTCPSSDPCAGAVCSVAAGGCIPKNDGGACTDNVACTLGDRCVSGACVPTSAKVCNDGNPCTDDVCDYMSGICVVSLKNGPCDDGTVCTDGDACGGGKCVPGPALNCDDKNTCTADSCDATQGCLHAILAGSACDDKSPCTVNDACTTAGACNGAGKQCHDDNPCTVDTCDLVLGCQYKPSAFGCDDSNACTTGEKCTSGVCGGGTAKDCDDKDLCTDDNCAASTGVCSHAFNNAPCDDGNPCSIGDACNLDACSPGKSSKNCDDGDACSVDYCTAVQGCVHKPSSTAPCSDGDACTTPDTCVGGKCLSGDPISCDDKNVCTDDLCLPSQGCSHSPASGPCDDGNACSGPDLCSGGKCSAQGGTVCDDSNACTSDGCDKQTGCSSYPLPNAVVCNDGNPCTNADVCNFGACQGQAVINCNDGNYCTLDSCSLATGCSHSVAVGGACSDGDPCTAGDQCSGGGVCVAGSGVACDDGNPCTVDACSKTTGCSHTAGSTGQAQTLVVVSDAVTTWNSNGNAVAAALTWDQYPGWTHAVAGAKWLWSTPTMLTPVVDTQVEFSRMITLPAGAGTVVASLSLAVDGGFVCLLGGKLAGVKSSEDNYLAPMVQPLTGKLKAGNNLLTCTVINPGKVGSTAQSNPAGLVFRVEATQFSPAGALPCNDGNACTSGDWCDGAQCQNGAPSDCDDNNACTFDGCSSKTGCAHSPSSASACSDGDPCTAGDTCQGATCSAGPKISCDDFDPCTVDACQAGFGCQHQAQSGSGCDDGNPCTGSDTCAAGSCKGAPLTCDDKNTCTFDGCSAPVGCYHTMGSGGPCDDGDICTSGDLCSGSVCVGGAPQNCDDGNPCTQDSCSAKLGCQHANSNLPCNDGSLCTFGDVCNGGACLAGALKTCSDGNPCTQDGCVAASGLCTFVPLTGVACDDGNFCTIFDMCGLGLCISGPIRDCSDTDPCTLDTCDSVSGACLHSPGPDGMACNDGELCTAGDKCAGGVCGGQVKGCDDNNPCTQDFCNPASGACLAKPLADGTSCPGGHCMGGSCQ